MEPEESLTSTELEKELPMERKILISPPEQGIFGGDYLFEDLPFIQETFVKEGDFKEGGFFWEIEKELEEGTGMRTRRSDGIVIGGFNGK